MVFNRTELKTLLPILIAIENGETIEYRVNNSKWITFVNIAGDNITWNLDGSKLEFRIKPEQKLVPFTFEDAESLIGKIIVSKDKSVYETINQLNINEINCSGYCYEYQYLLNYFTFLDGSPCGKYIN